MTKYAERLKSEVWKFMYHRLGIHCQFLSLAVLMKIKIILTSICIQIVIVNDVYSDEDLCIEI